jgi:phosphatidylserine/phosphatidylglycerophosphate/cardiolipin synthase-like enzyme
MRWRLRINRAFLPAVLLLSFGALVASGATACGDGSMISSPAVAGPGSTSGDDGTDGGTSGDPGGEGGAMTSGGPGTDGGGGFVHGPDTITVTVEPTDQAQVVLSAIQAAKKSVHMTMYLLNDKRFINALIAKHTAGLDVKVILNKTFPMNAGTNQTTFNTLQSAGVSVAWSNPVFTLTHEKCVVIDGASAWIMTMNLETTSSQNREYLALDEEPGDVKEADDMFAADFASTPYVPAGNLLVAPVNARDQLVTFIQTAKTSIDLEGEELSDYKIANALVAAQKAGVKVRAVVADNPPTAAQMSVVAQLKYGGVAVVSLGTPYIHAKAMVVDGAQAYVGSENFTTGSLQYNRELGLITTNAPTAATIGATIAKDFAAGTAL